MDYTTKIIANMFVAAAIGVVESRLPQNDKRKWILQGLRAATLAAINLS